MISQVTGPIGAMPNVGPVPGPQVGPVAGGGSEFMVDSVSGKGNPAVAGTNAPDAASAPSKAESGRAANGDFLSKIGVDLSGPFAQTGKRANDLMGRMHDYVGRVKSGELDPKSPEAQQFNMEMSMDLLKLQVESGRAAFQVELAAKVIEHGTSATKTIMQTQV